MDVGSVLATTMRLDELHINAINMGRIQVLNPAQHKPILICRLRSARNPPRDLCFTHRSYYM